MIFFKNRTAPIIIMAISAGASALAFMPTDKQCIAWPAFLCLVMFFWLWMTLWNRDHKIPFFDVGMFCALATLVYTVYPLINYWASGMRFGFLSDSRLQFYQILPAELGFFHLRHVLYLFSFIVFYSVFRGSGTIEVGNVNIPSRSKRQVIVLFFLLLTGFFFLLQLMAGVNFKVSYEQEKYFKNIAAFSRLPLLLLQIAIKLNNILFVFKLALLFLVVNHCKKMKWRIILLMWLIAEIAQSIYIKGARTDLVLFLMATTLLYYRLIKPFTMKFLIASGVTLFILFIFMGVYRQYNDFTTMRTGLNYSNSNIFSGTNEFQALLGTAYDVQQRKEALVSLPWYLYINDFVTVLPPRQLMPFEKVPASEWYLREIGKSGTGVGYMWGVISQSIVGLDWIELVFRGAILGFILALFHRWYLKHQSGFLETLFYVFFCVKVYYTFRNTTFSLLTNFVWEIIPFYIFLHIGVAFLSSKSKNRKKPSRLPLGKNRYRFCFF